jgi:hypothetical protein
MRRLLAVFAAVVGVVAGLLGLIVATAQTTGSAPHRCGARTSQ